MVTYQDSLFCVVVITMCESEVKLQNERFIREFTIRFYFYISTIEKQNINNLIQIDFAV